MAGIWDRLSGRKPCEVHFEDGPSVHVDKGSALMDAGIQAGVEIDSYCGRNCSCTTCKVIVVKGAKGLSPMAADERDVLGAKRCAEGYRLSCQAKVRGVVHVRVPEYF